LINYARFLEINPENALSITNNKFIRRFKKLEEMMLADGLDIVNEDLSTMDLYWNKAKYKLKKP